MEKQIKDYLHLYLRSDLLCKVKRKNDTEYHIGRLHEVSYKSNHGDWGEFWFDTVIKTTSSTFETHSSNSHWFFFGEDTIIPILRPLSDMTDEELNTCGNMIYDFSEDPELSQHKWEDFQIGIAPEQFHYLLKHGFDLFGLIDSGLALDKTTINQQ